MTSQLEETEVPAPSQVPAEGVTRLLWYEVEELPGPALYVRRVVRPGGSCFMRVWMVGWFGGLLLLSSIPAPLWFLLVLGLIGVGSFWFSFDTLGLGDQVWHAEKDLLVVRRSLFGWSRERRYTGAALQLVEHKGHDSHELALSVHRGEGAWFLFQTNYPSPEQLAEAAELAQRLAQITGWRLVTRSR